MNSTEAVVKRMSLVAALLAAGWLCLGGLAGAQELRAPTVELAVGRADFVDDAPVTHSVVGGAGRWYITPRLGLGPEVTYMRGPGTDRDLFVTGNVTYDFVSWRPRAPLLVPYVVGGGGFFRHAERFGSQTFTSYEGAFTGGGGLRVWVSERVSVAGEARLGWELHARYTAQVGLRLGR